MTITRAQALTINSRHRLWARIASGIGVVSLSALLIPGLAQSPEAQRPRRVDPPPEIETPAEIVRIDTDLVLVEATITDAAGQPVRGLRAEDFRLREDGVEIPISFFNVEKRGGALRPVAVVFAVDISGSMTADEIERLRGAMKVFTARLADRASVFAVVAFGMKVKVMQSFTSDPAKLDNALDRLIREPNGLSTHTYDAVDDAVRMLVKNAPRTRDRRMVKRAVVVVTDGFPVGDTVEPATVVERANAAEVSIYTVTLPSFGGIAVTTDSKPLPTPLDVSAIAERTGGRSVYATDKDFEPLFRSIAEDVTSAYVLAYYPSQEKRRDGQYHTITIEGPKGLTIRQSRAGYKAEKR